MKRWIAVLQAASVSLIFGHGLSQQVTLLSSAGAARPHGRARGPSAKQTPWFCVFLMLEKASTLSSGTRSPAVGLGHLVCYTDEKAAI